MESVLWSDKSKFKILFGKYGHHIFFTKEERDHLTCYQVPAYLMVWVVYYCLWKMLTHIEKHNKC